jgi:GNAT superfamily N-acetyltransferase
VTALTKGLTIRRLPAEEMAERTADLSQVLMDCVEGGASVSFMHPLTREKADTFWLTVKDRVSAGSTEVLVAELDDVLVGTVQLVMGLPENQPHRADVAKMLVHRRARRQGIGRMLMKAAEDVARTKGKTLLVLDTASGAAERLYRDLNWTVVGRVPGYALWPDGQPCDTTIFYKWLISPPATA